MLGSVRPIAKSVYVCDSVVRDPQSGKMTLFNLWDAVRVPDGAPFPFCLSRICVFVWWRGGLKNITSRIDIVQASTGDVVRRTPDIPTVFKDRTSSLYSLYRIEDCVFPEAGVYSIELFCNNTFVEDQAIEVLPPKGQ